MDITKVIADLKRDKDFAANVGMILAHNGIVRGSSRSSEEPVIGIEVNADQAKVEQIRQEINDMAGIYKVVVEALSGTMKPGDDLLFLVVAGDIRENVKPAMSLLLERIKSEAVTKREIFPE